MGERFRLKQSFDISGFSAANRVILQALKDYGMIVADNGSGWYLSGAPSSRWNDDELHALSSIAGSNFEAVDLSPKVASLDQTSGSTTGGASVTIHGQNFSGAAGQLQVRFGSTPATGVAIVSDTVLVATAPAHAAGQVDVVVQTPYAVSATSGADRFTFQTANNLPSARLFYKGSTAWDLTSNALPGFSDDNAIAPDKTAYLPGSAAASFANVSSYSRGINGLMIDLAAGHGAIRANDFTFKVGNSNSPNLWATAPAPTLVTTRTGAGVGGSDRVELMWADNVIQKQWLEVVVKGNDALGGSNANTGLSTSYVFYFGSAPGDSGTGDSGNSLVNAIDEQAARNDPHGNANKASITNVNDFDRNALVNAGDQQLTRAPNANNNATAPKSILIGPGGPFAPAAALPVTTFASRLGPLVVANDEQGIASALTATSRSSVSSLTVEGIAATPLQPTAEQRSVSAYFERLGWQNGELSRTELLDDLSLRVEPADAASCLAIDAIGGL
jgi:hypothetical protein